MSKVGIKRGPDSYLRPVEHPNGVRAELRLRQETQRTLPPASTPSALRAPGSDVSILSSLRSARTEIARVSQTPDNLIRQSQLRILFIRFS